MAEHGVPALERAFDILECLAGSPRALTIAEVMARTKLARSTVYRSLNTLQGRGAVRQVNETAYALGPKLISLARSVPQGVDLVTLARPILDELAREIGGSVKLSVVDGDDALVVATAEGPGAYSVTTQVGRRFPLHAGGASKLLLAHLSEDRRAAYLSKPLRAFTRRTVTDRARLERDLARIAKNGVAVDRGEYVEGVFAAAVAVKDQAGACVAAISAPFPEATQAKSVGSIRETLLRGAGRLSSLLSS